jgi:hypothetical protein
MEPENALDLGMIGGRLRTIQEMRMTTTSPFLPMAKLEAAIDCLQKSQAELFQARADLQEKGQSSYPNISTDNVEEYLVRVMDELEILETQHMLLLQEVPDDTNLPRTVYDERPGQNLPRTPASTPDMEWMIPVLPGFPKNPMITPVGPSTREPRAYVPLYPTEAPEKINWPDNYYPERMVQAEPSTSRVIDDIYIPPYDWLEGSNLDKLILRGKAWELPIDAWISMPDLFLLKSRAEHPLKTTAWKLERLKFQFWTFPQYRYELACLIYHFYCPSGDPIGPAQDFREWLTHAMEIILNPVEFGKLLLTLSNTRLYTEEELGLPLREDMEKKLCVLLWLSIPKSDGFGATQLMRQAGYGPVHSTSQYWRLLALYERMWMELE